MHACMHACMCMFGWMGGCAPTCTCVFVHMHAHIQNLLGKLDGVFDWEYGVLLKVILWK